MTDKNGKWLAELIADSAKTILVAMLVGGLSIAVVVGLVVAIASYLR